MPEEALNYIKRNLKKGHSEARIKKALTKAGHSDKDIQYYFKKHRSTKKHKQATFVVFCTILAIIGIVLIAIGVSLVVKRETRQSTPELPVIQEDPQANDLIGGQLQVTKAQYNDYYNTLNTAAIQEDISLCNRLTIESLHEKCLELYPIKLAEIKR